MNRVSYTVQAQADLREIVAYTKGTWGVDQAAEYLYGIQDCCERLAEFPRLGRTWKHRS